MTQQWEKILTGVVCLAKLDVQSTKFMSYQRGILMELNYRCRRNRWENIGSLKPWLVGFSKTMDSACLPGKNKFYKSYGYWRTFYIPNERRLTDTQANDRHTYILIFPKTIDKGVDLSIDLPAILKDGQQLKLAT